MNSKINAYVELAEILKTEKKLKGPENKTSKVLWEHIHGHSRGYGS